MAEGDPTYRLARRLEPVLVGALRRGELRAPRYAATELRGARVDPIETHGKHLRCGSRPDRRCTRIRGSPGRGR
jgi:hypothetical protein